MSAQSTIFIVSTFLILSCQTRNRQPRTQESVTKEAPDLANSFRSLGLPEVVSWDEVKGATQGEVPHPWSDTYWPLTKRGLAFRWMTQSVDSKISADPTSPFQQLEEMEIAAELKDQTFLSQLSPAEKHDLLVYGHEPIPQDLRHDLKASHDLYASNTAPRLKELNRERDAAEKLYKVAHLKMTELVEMRRALVTERKKIAASGGAALQKIEKELAANLSQITALGQEKKKHTAALAEIDAKIKDTAKDFFADTMQLARQLQQYRPLLGEAWAEWANYTATYDGNWSWMGHCHGWAPASLLEKPPRHAVLVKKNGHEVLFTAADIRGLLTKLWSDQAPETEFFGARRCEAKRLDLDRRGRILDGTLCYGKRGGSCSLKEAGTIIHVKNNNIEDGTLVFSESIDDDTAKVAVVQNDLGSNLYMVNVFENYDEFDAWYQTGGQRGEYREAVLHLTIGCRDTNPATFHTALTTLIKKGKGFVLDRTRGEQVWNQPAYKYELEYLPVVLNAKDPSGKTLSKPGELVAKGDVADPFRMYRAASTAYLAQVRAIVHYGVENGPLASYTVADEKDGKMVVTYTLEFDSDKNIVGGEWGEIPLPGKANAGNAEKRTLISGDAPDFMWYYPAGTRPVSGAVNKEFVEKLHACSRERSSKAKRLDVTNFDEKLEPRKATVTMEYSECLFNYSIQ